MARCLKPRCLGNWLSAAVDYDTDRALPRTSPPSIDAQRFNLTVRYRPRLGRDEFVIERFGSVSTVDGDPRFVPLVLERELSYVRVQGATPTARPLSNITQSDSQRVVTWVDADISSGSDGTDIVDKDLIGDQAQKTGIYALTVRTSLTCCAFRRVFATPARCRRTTHPHRIASTRRRLPSASSAAPC